MALQTPRTVAYSPEAHLIRAESGWEQSNTPKMQPQNHDLAMPDRRTTRGFDRIRGCARIVIAAAHGSPSRLAQFTGTIAVYPFRPAAY